MNDIHNDKNPLVSIVVITYNSAEYIQETLESIYNQTYPNIELIISDDYSKDNTIRICKKWIEQNKERFINTNIITTTHNTGVAANCNRGYKAAQGKWLKGIAGDDTFPPIAIEHYITFVANHHNCQLCSAQLHCFGNDSKKVLEAQQAVNAIWNQLNSLSPEEQYTTSIKKHILPGPGIFFTKKLWQEIGGYDEEYPFGEEFPFENKALKLTRAYCIPEPLVNYRISPGSLTGSSFSVSYISDRNYFLDVRQHLLLENKLYLEWWNQTLHYFIKHKEYQHSILYPYIKLLLLFSPLHLIRKIFNR